MDECHDIANISDTNAAPSCPASGESERDREALRIQAAAVAAQQAVLFEQEGVLIQKQAALEQQESQLGAHLEANRQSLLDLREQIRQARTDFRSERLQFEQQAAETAYQLDLDKAELADGQRQLHAQRQRLLKLRNRLKQRLHRHWAAKAESMKHREGRLADEQRRLNEFALVLANKENALEDERLHLNGEVALERHRLREAWDALGNTTMRAHESQARGRHDVRARTRLLETREQQLANAENDLAIQKGKWQTHREDLQREVQGLEIRIQNHRAKLLSLAWQSPEPKIADDCDDPGELLDSADNEISDPSERSSDRNGLQDLQRVALELSDQRLQLAKQWEDLSQTRQASEHEQAHAARELELAGARLRERQDFLEMAEETCRESKKATAYLRRRLENSQSQLTLRMTAWEADRDAMARELEERQDRLMRREEFLQEWSRRWRVRVRQFVGRLRSEYALCEQARLRYRLEREEWVGRNAILDQERRRLAEKALALEQYRQKYVVQAVRPASAEKRLSRLRRHWAYLTEAAAQELAKEHLALETEHEEVEKRHKHLFQLAGELAVREAELAFRDASSGSGSQPDERDWDKLHAELHVLQAQRLGYERNIAALTEEVERLARLLIDDDSDDQPLPILSRAA